MHGYGEYHDINSNILFIGIFNNNSYNGFGVLRNFAEDYIYIGFWNNNLRDGIGKSIKGNISKLGRYAKNIKIQDFETIEDLKILFKTNEIHLFKFFEFERREAVKYASLSRILNLN